MASCYEEIMKTKPYLPFKVGDKLPENIKAKAKEELGETEEVKAKTLPELRQMVLDEPGLVCPTDDAYLLQYLRPRKFNVKKSFSLLKNYYDTKTSYGDMFDTFDREALKRASNLEPGFVLPYRDEDGCVIVVMKLQKWDVDVTNVPEAAIWLGATILMSLQEPTTQICGIRLLIDAQINWKQIKSLTPRYIRLLTKALKNCFPVRFKGIHVYNESSIFQYIWSILRFFMPEKIKNRIHLHGDSQTNLHKYIPKAILPVEDYGGDHPNDISSWYTTEFDKFCETYRQLTTYGYKQ